MSIKFFASVLIAGMPAVAVADFYKCTAPDGKITYSDKRCATTTTVVRTPSAARGSGFIVPQSGEVADNPQGSQQLQKLANASRAPKAASAPVAYR